MHSIPLRLSAITGAALIVLSSSASAQWVVALRCAYLQSTYNGLYLSAELGNPGRYYGEIRARTAASKAGPWERFTIWRNGWYRPGQPLAFQSNANGKFIAQEGAGYGGDEWGLLRARTPQGTTRAGTAADIGAWETFTDPYFTKPDTSLLESSTMTGYPTAIMQYFGTQMNGAGGYDWGMLSGSKSDQMTYFYFNYIPCSGYDWQ